PLPSFSSHLDRLRDSVSDFLFVKKRPTEVQRQVLERGIELRIRSESRGELLRVSRFDVGTRRHDFEILLKKNIDRISERKIFLLGIPGVGRRCLRRTKIEKISLEPPGDRPFLRRLLRRNRLGHQRKKNKAYDEFHRVAFCNCVRYQSKVVCETCL